MKKILALLSLSACLLLIHACSRDAGDLPAEKQKPELLSNTMGTLSFPDDYPEWGTTGTNWPALTVSGTYSPMEHVYRSFEIQNSIYPLLGSSGYSLTPYIHVQWRKVHPNGAPISRWYNYHPTIREYTPLRIDTLPGIFHPTSFNWRFDLSSGMMPAGYLQVRARMLLSPTTEADRASATLWSTYDNRFENIYGYTDTGGPGGGQQVTVNINADIDVMINNPNSRYYDYLKLTAMGNSWTFYPSSMITQRATSTTTVTLEQSTLHNYTATVEAFLSGGTKVASYSTTFSNTILVTSSMGSSPNVYFDNFMQLNIP